MSRIAIVTRTHNRSLLLQRVLRTVGAQTAGDFVHIIVNDAGDPVAVDSLVASLDDGQREKTQVIHNLVSAGREAAVNPGFARARELGTDYTVVLDDDDTWEPEFLAQTRAFLDSHPEQVAVATRTTVIYETIDGDTVRELERGPLAADKHLVAFGDILQVNWVPPVSLLFRTSTLERLQGWRGDLPVLADWDFFMRLMCLGTVGFVETPLANWHHRRDVSGDLGNSVVVEASNHQDFHDVIRDEYLRKYLAGNADSRLGLALLLGHYQKETSGLLSRENARIQEKLEEQRQRREEIMDYTVSQIQAVGTAQAQLSSQVQHLQELTEQLLLHERRRGFSGMLRRLLRR